uniref:SHSP domain-containing protein n=1 Tax=Lates calcarifer TaxID=8187 RepID=A0A4W6FCQ5_LATCA
KTSMNLKINPIGIMILEVSPLLHQQDLLQRNLQELCSSLELMNKLQHKILEEREPFQTAPALQPGSYHLQKEAEHFGLTLDTQGFSPEELSVRQVGRKLRVCGKTENKQEDEMGCCFYQRHKFTQEFDLPEGLKPEDVTCYLAFRREEETQQSLCSHTEGSSTETLSSTQEPEHMD